MRKNIVHIQRGRGVSKLKCTYMFFFVFLNLPLAIKIIQKKKLLLPRCWIALNTNTKMCSSNSLVTIFFHQVLYKCFEFQLLDSFATILSFARYVSYSVVVACRPILSEGLVQVPLGYYCFSMAINIFFTFINSNLQISL